MIVRKLIPILAALPLLRGAPIDFATQFQPILAQRCALCHGPAQQMGGVRFDSRTAALAGGYSGPIIQPGRRADSLLIRMVTTGKDGKVMPPAGARLTEAEVGVLRAWIDQGASWPEDGATTG